MVMLDQSLKKFKNNFNLEKFFRVVFQDFKFFNLDRFLLLFLTISKTYNLNAIYLNTKTSKKN